jgi:hypothetical protein
MREIVRKSKVKGQKSKVRYSLLTTHCSLLLACCLLSAVARAQDLVVLKSGGVMEIKLSKAVERDYGLTRSQPLEFSVIGPAYVRVYSRVAWHEGMDPGEDYELVLRKPNGTRRDTLQANPSPTARGPDGEMYSKWRSFYFRALGGKNSYHLALGSAGADQVAVRFAFEEPPAWREAEPRIELPRLRLRRDSVETVSYVVTDTSQVQLLLVGPVHVAVEGRLNFVQGVLGKQSFSLAAFESDSQLAAQQFEVRRAKAVQCPDRKDLHPSISRRLKFDLPAGVHSVVVRFHAGAGASGVLRFLVRSKGSQ